MEQKKKVIGSTTYLVTQIDAVSALKIQTKLIKIIGPGIFGLADGKPTTEKLKKIVPALMENFDDEIVNELVLKLFEKNVFYEVDGQPRVLDFATHFTGKIMEMWQVAAFILEVNFAMGKQLGSSLPTTGAEDKTQDSSM